MQNRYNLADRESEEVLDYCEKHGIGFIPWFPLGAGELARAGLGARRDRARHGGLPARSRSPGC